MEVVGFSGSASGLSPAAATKLEWLLRSYGGGSFVHGCCVGADEETAAIARRLGYEIVGFPGPDGPKRSRFRNDVEHPPRPYMERNDVIVELCSVFLAAPSGTEEVLRSGTWATVRRAWKRGVPGVLVFPDGTFRPL